MRVTVAALLVAGALAATALAANGEPQKRLTRAGQAYARSLVVQAGDIGPGWKGKPSKNTGGNLRCKGFNPDESDLVETGEASGPDFTRGLGDLVSSSASVYRSANEAQTSWSRVVKPGLLDCLSNLLRQQATPDVKIRVLSSQAVSFPRAAPRQAAFRLIVEFTVREGARSVTLKPALDVILLGRGQADVAVYTMALLKPFAPQFEPGLIRALAARLRA
jgi:hypothetical protein